MASVESRNPLVGLRISLIIEEDGTPTPPELPRATILRRMGNPHGGYYFLIRLDQPVKSVRAKTGEEWTILNLLIWPSFQGGSLEPLLKGDKRIEVPVGISNVMGIESDSPILDPSKLVYFARGVVRIAG
ncbi:hypothetical protein J2P12_07875 [Candidatus Bathyarchaeota archaeon]|nr:hypothetical protein [Candidatus Bathyarchaeota archaeon]